MNKRHPDKTLVSYYEDAETFETLEKFREKKRWDRSQTLREATSGYVQHLLNASENAEVLAGALLQTQRKALLKDALSTPTPDDREDATRIYTSYTEWKDTRACLDQMAKLERVSRSKIIRDATRWFIQNNIPPNANANETPADKPASRSILRRTRKNKNL